MNSMEFTPDERVDSPPIPLSQPTGDSSEDTPTLLLRQLQYRRRQRINDFPCGTDQLSQLSSQESSCDVPLLSVLNVVVDHSMVPPTPMEPEEFEEATSDLSKSGSILVPLLRVFGPLIRGGETQPVQSACLYIHGAFPYLLARPVVAGPDGSLGHASHLEDATSSGHVDWDDVESVQRIVQDIQSNLETALQSYQGNVDESKKQQQAAPKPPRFIRRVTIVVGRGFYTYCPGPPAPFLRIEYYNPKLKWLVKRTLERGLEVPLSFHPDPQQYDATLRAVVQPDTENDALRFHCYEAHIPYTMQFFKDYNLSGMSYIQVSEGRFRGPMPKTLRQKTSTTSGGLSQGGSFLKSNVSPNLLWEAQPLISAELCDGAKRNRGVESLQQSSTGSNKRPEMAHNINDIGDRGIPCDSGQDAKKRHWTRKETSCDLEFDTCAQHILNIKSVMTSLPDDPTEREQIHWRAVPSLREIWRQERQRMSTLLKPKDDFLSCGTPKSHGTSPPPFTLNVKKGASIPGAKLAVAGMKKLFQSVPGTETDFRLAMKDIVKKHATSIDHADNRIRNRSSKTTHASSTPSGQRTYSAARDLTPSEDETMDALDALASQFHEGELSSSPALSDVPPYQLTQNSDDTDLANSDGREAYTMDDEVVLSQRVDRGDSIVDLHTQDGSPCHVEDFIDPHTLTPYENPEDLDDEGFLHDEDQMGEDELERTLSAMASDSLARDSSTTVEHSMLSYDDDDDEHDAMYDTDTCDADDAFDAASENDSVEDPDSSQERGIYLTQNFESCGSCTASSPDYRNSTNNSQELSGDTNAIALNGAEPRMSLRGLLTSCDRSGTTDIILERTAGAPRRGEVMESTNKVQQLHPTSRDVGNPPSWLEYSAAYQSLSQNRLSKGNKSHFDSPFPISTECYLEPVKRPPNRHKVASWLKKKRKRNEEQDSAKRSKGNNTPDDKKGCKKAIVSLQIDENSRKLTALPASGDRKDRKSVLFLNNNGTPPGDGQEIEEVEWDIGDDMPSQEQSQQLPLSLSQGETIAPEKESLHTTRAVATARTAVENRLAGREAEAVHVLRDQASQSDFDNASTGLYCSVTSSNSPGVTCSESQSVGQALEGIGQQGGRIFIEGGGGLKTTNRGMDGPSQNGSRSMGLAISSAAKKLSSSYNLPSPITVMSIEIHVQCRTGRAGVNDSKEIAMKPNSDKDSIFAIGYVLGLDPGRGEALKILERGCLFVPVETEQAGKHDTKRVSICIPRQTLGISSVLKTESVRNERQLLLRIASIVRLKDPDMILSWDTQGAGLGYLIERGAQLGKKGGEHTREASSGVDMVRLLGRTPTVMKSLQPDGLTGKAVKPGIPTADKNPAADVKDESRWDHQWTGSGLGSEWDDRVGPGAAAASIAGRLVFCGWKIIAEEVKHPNASYLPAMVSTVLNKRIPHHDDLVLTRWYGADKGRERWRVLHHRLAQGVACLLMFDALDVIGRAGEAARLSGVEFSQSFPGIRGSQYKVEGVLLRALKSIQSDERGAKRGQQKTKLSDDGNRIGIDPSSVLSDETTSQTQSPWKLRRKLEAKFRPECSENQPSQDDHCYFFYSPSREDTSRQEALECQALTLEPESSCYHDPIVVCDFTALYPSLVIAYNLCYSTCAGKLEYQSTRREMGRLGQTTNHLGPFFYPESRTATVLAHHMKTLFDPTLDSTTGHQQPLIKDRAYVVPTGSIFLAESVLKGVLPQVLDEMLSTRAMLKKAAKEYKKLVPDLSPSILRQLEARQLALKYVANVTYGYTSATFSGRCAMPLLADAIVECGRKTLRNAINLANEWGREKNGRWFGAKVVYGDTDSVFVKLPGRSVKEAFEFGEAFCKAVTASNPPPVQLKLEKVYGASIMQTKKKYCGMKYESADQKKPTFEAKGIETVRRDQCALTQKVLRNALTTLFRSGIDAVRTYLYRQWSLIRSGRLPVSDFILTGRVRSQYRGGRIGPVQAALARRLAEADPGRTVRHKERLAYVIVATPGANWRLRDCVLTPMELLEQWDAYSIHTAYYITKHVNAALQRCLGLSPFKVNVNAWYEACPKPRRRIHFWPTTRSGNSQMISSYFGSDICSLCGQKCKAQGRAKAVVCETCRKDGVQSSHIAMSRWNKVQHDAQTLAKTCSKCNGCFESAETFAALRFKANDGRTSGAMIVPNATRRSSNSAAGIVTPIANCSCIDCPTTYERHRLRETELEVVELCKALELI